MPLRPEFERALLALDLDAPRRDAIEVATYFAELLKLNLVGLFALDDTLRELAAYPGAREFVPAGGAWRPIDIDRIVHEQTLAAQAAHRAFRELTGAIGVPTTFEIVAGPATQAFVSMCRALDILVVAEPTRASACATHAFSLLLDAAMRSPAAVLLVPRSVRRRRGPIVAVAGAPDEAGIEVASAIAAAAHEELIVIDAYRRAPTGPLTDMGRLSGLLESRSESLIVITRDRVAAADVGLVIAGQRRVPVLILEPPSRPAP